MECLAVFNTGSSSVKYQLFELATLKRICKGAFSHKQGGSLWEHSTPGDTEHAAVQFSTCQFDTTSSAELLIGLIMDAADTRKAHFDRLAESCRDDEARAALCRCFEFWRSFRDSFRVVAAGHRVVHGGPEFTRPVLISDDILGRLDATVELAPLHNAASIGVIRALEAKLGPGLRQVAVFDTAFHASIPSERALYALPLDVAADMKIKRYGFHGISYEFVSRLVANRFPGRYAKMILAHLGSGSSACAVDDGKSVATSMGMTPLEGLVMGTRSGDLDPSVVLELARGEAKRAFGADGTPVSRKDVMAALDSVERLLNKESGLVGVCGWSDMRDVVDRMAHDPKARLAFDMFCTRVAEYIGAYMVLLGGADLIVFTGGVGEHTPAVWAQVCRNMAFCGVVLADSVATGQCEKTPRDGERGGQNSGDQQTRGGQQLGDGIRFVHHSTKSKVHVCVVATDEELRIAEHMKDVLEQVSEE